MAWFFTVCQFGDELAGDSGQSQANVLMPESEQNVLRHRAVTDYRQRVGAARAETEPFLIGLRGQLEHFMRLARQVAEHAGIHFLVITRDLDGTGKAQALVHRRGVKPGMVPTYRAVQ